MGARYYDPSLGRFITADTIVQDPTNPVTMNRYHYSGNNPVNFVDPDGHGFWGSIWKAIKDTVKFFFNFQVPGAGDAITGEGFDAAKIGIGIGTGLLTAFGLSLGGANFFIQASVGLNIIANTAEQYDADRGFLSGLRYASLATGVVGAGIEIKGTLSSGRGGASAAETVSTSSTYQRLSAPEYRENVLTMMYNSAKGGHESVTIAQLITEKAAFTAGVVVDTLGEYYSRTAATISKFAPAWKTGIKNAKNLARGFGAAGFALDAPVYFEIAGAWQAGSISTGQMVAAMAVHTGGIGVTTAGAALGAAGGAALLAPTTIGATYGAAAGAGVGGGFASWGVGIAENKFYQWIGMRP